MNTRAFLAAALAVVSTTLSAAAQQPWIKDRATGEGIGIRTGNLELHPGVAGEIGYDSNYFQRADNEQPIIDVFRLRVTPHLTLKTLGPQRRGPGAAAGAPPTVNFTAGVYVAYNYLIAADSEHQDAVDDNNHVVNAGASFTLDVLPQRPFGFDMYGDFVRTAEPSNLIVNDTAFDRDSLRLGLGVNWRPGGGLFEWRLGYELGYHFFENDAWTELNNSQHTIMTRGRFRFLPRTALIYDGRVTFVRYSDTVSQNDGEVLNSKIGVNGLITHHFGLLALAGWTASFYETNGNVPARNYEGLTAHAELKWFILPQPTLQPGEATVGLSTVAVGYVRDYGNSYLGDYFRRDRGYLNFSYFIGGVAIISLEGGYSHYAHSSSFFPNGTQRRGAFGQNRVDATLFGEYRLSDSVGVNTTLRYNASLGENNVRSNQDDPAEFDNLQFSRYEAYLGVRWFM
jgi:hypothetical protein